MFYDTLERYKEIGVGDEIRIRGKYIPPCSFGTNQVHKDFITYIKDCDNLFTITDLKVAGVEWVVITVFEVMGLLEYKHVMIPRAGKIRVFNWSDRWKQKVSNLRMEVK